MHAWETIEQSLTYIEEYLTEEISTEELANTVCLSPFYFQRLFKRLVNKPVQEYFFGKIQISCHTSAPRLSN